MKLKILKYKKFKIFIIKRKFINKIQDYLEYI